MIYPGPLNREQRLRTQKNYNIFCLINGMAYMCLGETIIVLFSIKLDAPNGMVAALGAVLYFSYFMLPVGKMVAARVGAARSQSIFWTARNFVALIVAASAITAYCGFEKTALVQIFIGACLFYGMRAAGVVMAQPFIGDMATEEERPHLLGVSSALFYGGCMFSLMILWYILSISESVWTITAIISFGACLGVTSTRYIRRMDESPAMIRAARRKILPEIREIMGNYSIRKLILAMFVNTLAIILVGSVSILSVKRGYNVSDTAALYFSLIQFVSATGSSFLYSVLVRKLGMRYTLYWGYAMLLATAVLWLAAPGMLNYVFVTLIFIIIGAGQIFSANAMISYLLAVAPQRLWVTTSMVTSAVTSAGAGCCAMAFSSLLFKLIGKFSGDWEALSVFKVYFSLVLSVLLLFSVFIWQMGDVKGKKA